MHRDVFVMVLKGKDQSLTSGEVVTPVGHAAYQSVSLDVKNIGTTYRAISICLMLGIVKTTHSTSYDLECDVSETTHWARTACRALGVVYLKNHENVRTSIRYLLVLNASLGPRSLLVCCK